MIELIQIEKSLKKENSDELSSVKRELMLKQQKILAKKENQKSYPNPKIEKKNIKDFGEIPLSLSEKSKYGYAYDLNKFKTEKSESKIIPKDSPHHPIAPVI